MKKKQGLRELPDGNPFQYHADRVNKCVVAYSEMVQAAWQHCSIEITLVPAFQTGNKGTEEIKLVIGGCVLSDKWHCPPVPRLRTDASVVEAEHLERITRALANLNKSIEEAWHQNGLRIVLQGSLIKRYSPPITSDNPVAITSYRLIAERRVYSSLDCREEMMRLVYR